MSTRTRELLGIAVGCVAVACAGNGSSECPTGTVPVGDGCVEVASDAGLGGADSRPEDAAGQTDADFECAAGAPDPIDGVDQDCDGHDGIATEQVYVATTGDDSNAGVPGAPFRTIARALETDRRVVIVARGEYAETIAIVSASKSLHGGYDAETWRRTEERAVITLIDGPLLATSADRADALVLDQIDVRAPTVTEPGSSSIAIVSDGLSLHLSNARVVATAGAEGRAGADGMPGQRGADGNAGVPCDGHPSCTSGVASATASVSSSCGTPMRSGAGGATAMRGLAASTGAAGGGVPIHGGPGMAGEDGRDGARGSDGAGGAGLGDLTTMGYLPPRASSGTPGTPGTAGGGGSGGNGHEYTSCASSGTTFDPDGGSGGSGATGGCGGHGGIGGEGGGASVAMIVSNADLVMTRSIVVTAGGGRGGRGGAGGSSGPGGARGVGGGRLCSTGNRLGWPGGNGGAGGDGGEGGHGGGGAGGPSIGVVLLGTAEIESDDTTFDLGPAGVGGRSDGNVGAPGMLTELLDLR